MPNNRERTISRKRSAQCQRNLGRGYHLQGLPMAPIRPEGEFTNPPIPATRGACTAAYAGLDQEEPCDFFVC